jgi:hypothetical protein
MINSAKQPLANGETKEARGKTIQASIDRLGNIMNGRESIASRNAPGDERISHLKDLPSEFREVIYCSPELPTELLEIIGSKYKELIKRAPMVKWRASIAIKKLERLI